jgi:tetratricopeptide (TPR) repeat protein
VKRDNLAYLISGLFYGALIGFGAFYLYEHRPGSPPATSAPIAPSPAGPPAPGQQAGGPGAAGAPMMEEINALKHRLKDAPDDPQALIRLANLYHDVEMWPQAVEYYERAIEVVPGNPDLLTDLGVCYQNEQEFDRALEMFDRAQEADPSHWQSLYNIVIVAGLVQGELDRAEAALARLQEVNPSAPRLDWLRANLQHAREQMAAQGDPS